VRFRVRAEMLSKPLDIPIEFIAEIDVSAGKIMLPRLPGSA
jgi:type VI secretion system protein ImpF